MTPRRVPVRAPLPTEAEIARRFRAYQDEDRARADALFADARADEARITAALMAAAADERARFDELFADARARRRRPNLAPAEFDDRLAAIEERGV
jgi:cell pole-organizing protein PopZ